jgi:hypothetical protein
VAGDDGLVGVLGTLTCGAVLVGGSTGEATCGAGLLGAATCGAGLLGGSRGAAARGGFGAGVGAGLVAPVTAWVVPDVALMVAPAVDSIADPTWVAGALLVAVEATRVVVGDAARAFEQRSTSAAPIAARKAVSRGLINSDGKLAPEARVPDIGPNTRHGRIRARI